MAHRWRVLDGPPDADGNFPKATPAAGGRVDTIDPDHAKVWTGGAAAGRPIQMVCGGSFSKGASLAIDANGRAVAAGSGDTAWVVMLTQA